MLSNVPCVISVEASSGLLTPMQTYGGKNNVNGLPAGPWMGVFCTHTDVERQKAPTSNGRWPKSAPPMTSMGQQSKERESYIDSSICHTGSKRSYFIGPSPLTGGCYILDLGGLGCPFGSSVLNPDRFIDGSVFLGSFEYTIRT